MLTFQFCFVVGADKVTAEKNGPSKAQSNNSSSSPPSSNSHIVAGSTTTTTATTTTSSSPPHQLETTSVAPETADISGTEATPAVTALPVTQTTVTVHEGITTATTTTPTAVDANHINNNAEKAIISSASTNDNGCSTDVIVKASAAEDESINNEDDSLPAIANASDTSLAGKEVSTGSLKKVIMFKMS